jgi:hypothetical protein
MATRVRRSTEVPSIPSIYKDASTYIRARADKIRSESVFRKSARRVKEWLGKNGATDADGNIYYHFPSPVPDADGQMWAGVHHRYDGNAAPYFIEDEVRQFLLDKYAPGADYGKLLARCFPSVTITNLDPEQIYLLEQEGTITKQELRQLLHEGEKKYSLWPIEYDPTEVAGE